MRNNKKRQFKNCFQEAFKAFKIAFKVLTKFLLRNIVISFFFLENRWVMKINFRWLWDIPTFCCRTRPWPRNHGLQCINTRDAPDTEFWSPAGPDFYRTLKGVRPDQTCDCLCSGLPGAYNSCSVTEPQNGWPRNMKLPIVVFNHNTVRTFVWHIIVTTSPPGWPSVVKRSSVFCRSSRSLPASEGLLHVVLPIISRSLYQPRSTDLSFHNQSLDRVTAPLKMTETLQLHYKI